MTALADLFPENLRAERARAQLSQRELALTAGLTESYISKLERGARDPPLTTVDAIAKALKVSPLILLQPAKK